MDEGDVTDVLDPLMAESESDQDEDDSEEESDGDDVDDDAEVSDEEEEDEESEEDSDVQMDESDSDDDSKESLEDSEMDDADDSEDSEDEPIGKDLGFEWDAKEASDDAALGKSTDQDSDKVALSKREKKRLREARELEILHREQALRDGDQVPESAQEFEKLLIASPRSSFLWVRYMAFHVSCGAYEEAKEVAERVIVAIPASEESERMNVWAAYLNLENKYGTPSPEEAVQKLFKRAVQIASAKHMYMTLISMYERNGQDEPLEENLKKAVKKFSYSLKVWMAYIRTNVLKGDSEAARKLLDRATQALPKHKHIKLLMRTALLEMKEGNPERGRTMFEGILRNYPRRTDIWSVYIDQEIKQGDTQRIRALFERATHLDLNAKSMKFLFKRYLDFERSEGDSERIAHVKKRAMEYVSNKFGTEN
jgi:rRNA biogenesis protein RRP5